MKTTLITAISLAISANAYAVKFGEDVTASEYKDYIVRIEVPSPSGIKSTCGGLLIGGEYILTAGHCVGTYSHNGSSVQYQWHIDNGAENAISVYQGVQTYSDKHIDTTYQVLPLLDTLSDEQDAYAEALQEYAAVKNDNAGGDWSFMDGLLTHSYLEGVWHRDIALIKLTKSVPQANHAAISPIYNPNTGVFVVGANDALVFKGWGATESESQPQTMQKGVVTFSVADYIYTPNVALGDAEQGLCLNDGSQCNYKPMDYLTTTPPSVGATASDGDSGTPLVLNDADNVVGLAKDTDYNTNSRFTSIGYYLPSIKLAINKVTAPKEIKLDVNAGSNSVKVHKFTVQNLTQNNEVLLPYLVDNTGLFSVSGCDQTLVSGDSCEITVTINAAQEAMTETKSATLYLSDTDDTNFPISYVVPQKDDSNTGGGESGGGSGGSGGSLNWFAVLALGCLRFFRKH
ncbi:trypsin-like serine protease [Vibrio sp. 1180_3]|uniref:trypsin-like serine protease n=1 Tax=Vibrio sp. 1180_3 TaxID=2528832 RepID=UPI0024067012|nr:trypsin-like serine protease [Vibrio sp. 1180_3]MDF9399067.1 trypsin-like serine protease [Vibrio sp. 1180_3]